MGLLLRIREAPSSKEIGQRADERPKTFSCSIPHRTRTEHTRRREPGRRAGNRPCQGQESSSHPQFLRQLPPPPLRKRPAAVSRSSSSANIPSSPGRGPLTRANSMSSHRDRYPRRTNIHRILFYFPAKFRWGPSKTSGRSWAPWDFRTSISLFSTWNTVGCRRFDSAEVILIRRMLALSMNAVRNSLASLLISSGTRPDVRRRRSAGATSAVPAPCRHRRRSAARTPSSRGPSWERTWGIPS